MNTLQRSFKLFGSKDSDVGIHDKLDRFDTGKNLRWGIFNDLAYCRD